MYSVLIWHRIGWLREATYGREEHARERAGRLRVAGYRVRVLPHDGPLPILADYGAPMA